MDRTVKIENGRQTTLYLDILNALGTENVAYCEYNEDYSEREAESQTNFIFVVGFEAEF